MPTHSTSAAFRRVFGRVRGLSLGLIAVLAAASLLVAAGSAEARSSGGYSRPSMSISHSSSGYRPSPSFRSSGGYARP